MGNRAGSELTPEEKQHIKEQKEKEKENLKKEKEKRLREKIADKNRKKLRKKSKNICDKKDTNLNPGWSDYSDGSGRSDEVNVDSGPDSWYHSASEPSSRRSSIYFPASTGSGYYKHECWYQAYENGSDKSLSKSRSRTPTTFESIVQKVGSTERYPLGIPSQEAINPTSKLSKPDIRLDEDKKCLSNKFDASTANLQLSVSGGVDDVTKMITESDAIQIAELKEKAVTIPRSKLVSSTYADSVTELPKIDTITPNLEVLQSKTSSLYYSTDEENGSKIKRKVKSGGSQAGSVYYSADEGSSFAGSVYYSANSGSEMEDFDCGEFPSPPGAPEAVDRDGEYLNKSAYYRVESDALMLRWDRPVTDGGSPITGYVIEKCENQSEQWIRVNLIPTEDNEYAVANLQGGKEYRFRVSAENTNGSSDVSPSSDIVAILSDQEATEPHFLRELRDVAVLKDEDVEISVDIVGMPVPDVIWYKDESAIYDTKKYLFKNRGDRYSLVIVNTQLDDAGDIKVRASNRVGVASSQAILSVEASPKIILSPDFDQHLSFDVDEGIRLKILYSGSPPPSAIWTHNGIEIKASSRCRLDVSEKFASMKIDGIDMSCRGQYSLTLFNCRGEDSKFFFVNITGRPDTPGKPVISDIIGQSVTLQWKPPTDDGGSTVTNYIIEYYRVGWDVWLKSVCSPITWTQLNELIVGSEYRFRIKAENGYGLSDPSPESGTITIEEGTPTGSFEDEDISQGGNSLINNIDYSCKEIQIDSSSETSARVPTRNLMEKDMDDYGASEDSTEKMYSEEDFDIHNNEIIQSETRVPADIDNNFEMEEYLGIYMNKLDAFRAKNVPETDQHDISVNSRNKNISKKGFSESSRLEEKIRKETQNERDTNEINILEGISTNDDKQKTNIDFRSTDAVYRTSSSRDVSDVSRRGHHPQRHSAFEVPSIPSRTKRSTSRASLMSEKSFKSELLGQETSPVPPPRNRRSTSSTSLCSTGSYGFDMGILHSGQESPLPPPRSRKSTSRTSLASDTSLLDVPLQNFGLKMDSPTPPIRRKRLDSKASATSDISLQDESPIPPPRYKRTGSQLSNVSQLENTENEPMPPKRTKRSSSRSSISSLSGFEVITGEQIDNMLNMYSETTKECQLKTDSYIPSDNFDGALSQSPCNTPSRLGGIKARMESVGVAEGGEAVLVVALEGVPYKEIIWCRSGKPLCLNANYETYSTEDTSNLVIHKTTCKDTGTYTLLATKSDGTQARASVLLHVTSSKELKSPNAPEFVRTLCDTTSKVGTQARFLVELRESENVQVHWYQCNKEIFPSAKTTIIHDGNYYGLYISPLLPEDEGPWRCTVESPFGQINSSALLRVVVPKGYKAPVFLEKLDAILTDEGTVSLECKVVGVPTPVLKWYKDGEEIRAGDIFALTANPNDPTSLGTYKCEAVNCMGKASSSSKVRVLSREGGTRAHSSIGRTSTPVGPPKKLLEELRDQKVKIGEKSMLSIKVSENPSDIQSVTWYKNGKAIEPNDKYRLCDEGGGSYSLSISSTERGDDGEWKVVVKTQEGYAYSNCALTLSVPRNYRPPRFLENLRALLTEEGLVSFECKVVGYPTPQLQWYKDGEELKPGDVYQLSGTNSLGKYSCIARNCMGTVDSSAELTFDDIKPHLNDEEKEQLLATNVPPKFIQGLRSKDLKIGDATRLSVQITTNVSYSVSWHRDDEEIESSNNYLQSETSSGQHYLDIQSLALIDQAEWKCEAKNEFGHSISSANVKLLIPRQYKKPVFLEALRATLSQEGTVNLECKVIGVPQPTLNWFKDGIQLKPGDIHKIISGEGGTCGLGTYTCQACNCMGSVSSSANLLSYEEQDNINDKISDGILPAIDQRGIVKNPSLSTINEERSSQVSMYESVMDAMSNESKTEVYVSIDGKELSVSIYETPDLSEYEAKQIAEIYADEISDNLAGKGQNVAELPPLRFTKETSCKGSVVAEATVIDVESEAFENYISFVDCGFEDLRTEADSEELSAIEPIIIDEKETYRSDIANIPEIEAFEELQLSTKLTSFQGKQVPEIGEVYLLDTDLKTLSEQGISLLRSKTEILTESDNRSYAGVYQTEIIADNAENSDRAQTPIVSSETNKLSGAENVRDSSKEIYLSKELEQKAESCIHSDKNNRQDFNAEMKEKVLLQGIYTEGVNFTKPAIINVNKSEQAIYSIEYIPHKNEELYDEVHAHSIKDDNCNIELQQIIEVQTPLAETSQAGNISDDASQVNKVSFPEEKLLLNATCLHDIYVEENNIDHFHQELYDLNNPSITVTFIDDEKVSEISNRSIDDQLSSQADYSVAVEIESSDIQKNIVDECNDVATFEDFCKPIANASCQVEEEFQIASDKQKFEIKLFSDLRNISNNPSLSLDDPDKFDAYDNLNYIDCEMIETFGSDVGDSISLSSQNKSTKSVKSTFNVNKEEEEINFLSEKDDVMVTNITNDDVDKHNKNGNENLKVIKDKTIRGKQISIALKVINIHKNAILNTVYQQMESQFLLNEPKNVTSELLFSVERDNVLDELKLEAIEIIQSILESDEYLKDTNEKDEAIIYSLNRELKIIYEVDKKYSEMDTIPQFIFNVKSNLLDNEISSEEIVSLTPKDINNIKLKLLEDRSKIVNALKPDDNWMDSEENNSQLRLLSDLKSIEDKIKEVIIAQLEVVILHALEESSIDELDATNVSETCSEPEYGIVVNPCMLNEAMSTVDEVVIVQILDDKKKDLEKKIQDLECAKELCIADSSIKEYIQEAEPSIDFNVVDVKTINEELTNLTMELNAVIVMKENLMQPAPQFFASSITEDDSLPTKIPKLKATVDVTVEDCTLFDAVNFDKSFENESITEDISIEQLINKRNELQFALKEEIIMETEDNNCSNDALSSMLVQQKTEQELKQVVAAILEAEVTNLVKLHKSEHPIIFNADSSFVLELEKSKQIDANEIRQFDLAFNDIAARNDVKIDFQKVAIICKIMGEMKATMKTHLLECEELTCNETPYYIELKNNGELPDFFNLSETEKCINEIEDLENLLEKQNFDETIIKLLTKFRENVKNLPIPVNSILNINTVYKIDFNKILNSHISPVIHKKLCIKSNDKSTLDIIISEQDIPYHDIKQQRCNIENELHKLSAQLGRISPKSESDISLSFLMQNEFIQKMSEILGNDLKIVNEIEKGVNYIFNKNINSLSNNESLDLKSENNYNSDLKETITEDNDLIKLEEHALDKLEGDDLGKLDHQDRPNLVKECDLNKLEDRCQSNVEEYNMNKLGESDNNQKIENDQNKIDNFPNKAKDCDVNKIEEHHSNQSQQQDVIKITENEFNILKEHDMKKLEEFALCIIEEHGINKLEDPDKNNVAELLEEIVDPLKLFNIEETKSIKSESLLSCNDDENTCQVITFIDDKGDIQNIEIQLEDPESILVKLPIELPSTLQNIEIAEENKSQDNKEDHERALSDVIEKKRNILALHKKMLDERQKIAEVTSLSEDTDNISLIAQESLTLENSLETLEEQLQIVITTQKEIELALSAATEKQTKDNYISNSEESLNEEINNYMVIGTQIENNTATEQILFQKRKYLEDKLIKASCGIKNKNEDVESESDIRILEMELENVILMENNLLIDNKTPMDPHKGEILVDILTEEVEAKSDSSNSKMKLIYKVIGEDLIDDLTENIQIPGDVANSNKYEDNIEYILLSQLNYRKNELSKERENILKDIEEIETLDFSSPLSIDILESSLHLKAKLENIDKEIHALISAKDEAEMFHTTKLINEQELKKIEYLESDHNEFSNTNLENKSIEVSTNVDNSKSESKSSILVKNEESISKIDSAEERNDISDSSKSLSENSKGEPNLIMRNEPFESNDQAVNDAISDIKDNNFVIGSQEESDFKNNLCNINNLENILTESNLDKYHSNNERNCFDAIGDIKEELSDYQHLKDNETVTEFKKVDKQCPNTKCREESIENEKSLNSIKILNELLENNVNKEEENKEASFNEDEFLQTEETRNNIIDEKLHSDDKIQENDKRGNIYSDEKNVETDENEDQQQLIDATIVKEKLFDKKCQDEKAAPICQDMNLNKETPEDCNEFILQNITEDTIISHNNKSDVFLEESVDNIIVEDDNSVVTNVSYIQNVESDKTAKISEDAVNISDSGKDPEISENLLKDKCLSQNKQSTELLEKRDTFNETENRDNNGTDIILGNANKNDNGDPKKILDVKCKETSKEINYDSELQDGKVISNLEDRKEPDINMTKNFGNENEKQNKLLKLQNTNQDSNIDPEVNDDNIYAKKKLITELSDIDTEILRKEKIENNSQRTDNDDIMKNVIDNNNSGNARDIIQDNNNLKEPQKDIIMNNEKLDCKIIEEREKVQNDFENLLKQNEKDSQDEKVSGKIKCVEQKQLVSEMTDNCQVNKGEAIECEKVTIENSEKNDEKQNIANMTKVDDNEKLQHRKESNYINDEDDKEVIPYEMLNQTKSYEEKCEQNSEAAQSANYDEHEGNNTNVEHIKENIKTNIGMVEGHINKNVRVEEIVNDETKNSEDIKMHDNKKTLEDIKIAEYDSKILKESEVELDNQINVDQKDRKIIYEEGASDMKIIVDEKVKIRSNDKLSKIEVDQVDNDNLQNAKFEEIIDSNKDELFEITELTLEIVTNANITDNTLHRMDVDNEQIKREQKVETGKAIGGDDNKIPIGEKSEESKSVELQIVKDKENVTKNSPDEQLIEEESKQPIYKDVKEIKNDQQDGKSNDKVTDYKENNNINESNNDSNILNDSNNEDKSGEKHEELNKKVKTEKLEEVNDNVNDKNIAKDEDKKMEKDLPNLDDYNKDTENISINKVEDEKVKVDKNQKVKNTESNAQINPDENNMLKNKGLNEKVAEDENNMLKNKGLDEKVAEYENKNGKTEENDKCGENENWNEILVVDDKQLISDKACENYNKNLTDKETVNIKNEITENSAVIKNLTDENIVKDESDMLVPQISEERNQRKDKEIDKDGENEIFNNNMVEEDNNINLRNENELCERYNTQKSTNKELENDDDVIREDTYINENKIKIVEINENIQDDNEEKTLINNKIEEIENEDLTSSHPYQCLDSNITENNKMDDEPLSNNKHRHKPVEQIKCDEDSKTSRSDSPDDEESGNAERANKSESDVQTLDKNDNNNRMDDLREIVDQELNIEVRDNSNDLTEKVGKTDYDSHEIYGISENNIEIETIDEPGSENAYKQLCNSLNNEGKQQDFGVKSCNEDSSPAEIDIVEQEHGHLLGTEQNKQNVLNEESEEMDHKKKRKRREERRKRENDVNDIKKSVKDARLSNIDMEYTDRELLDHHLPGDERIQTLSSNDDMKSILHQKPKFSQKLQDQQVKKGTLVKLKCTISSLDDILPDIEWFKSGYPLNKNDRIIASFINKVASLEIKDVTKSDSGEYTCSITNNEERTSTTCDLRVKGDEPQKPTAPSFTTTLRDRFVPEEDEFVISCHVTGHPTPKIKWLKNADQLPTSPRFYTSVSEDGICKLVIKSPKPGDTGLYTCHAENRIYRDEISSTIHVQALHGQPLPTEHSELPRFITELCDQYVLEHGTLTLQVEVAGLPVPDVIWLFNGRSLPSSGKYRVSDAGHIHTLTVFQVAKHDMGLYSCKLRNKLGSAYTLSAVSFGSSKPKRKYDSFPTAVMSGDKSTAPSFIDRPDCLVTVFRDEEIRLSCVVDGDPAPRVSWYKGTKEVTHAGRAKSTVRDNRHTIVIRKAEYTDSGTYKVEAKNSEGSSRAYCSIKVRERISTRNYSSRPSQSRSHQMDADIDIRRRSPGRYIRDLPGIIGEPQITDVGYNWVCLGWKKAEKTGGGPVTAYKVEAWILGEEARWQEMGISPIPSFDAYHLKTDKEYLFRVTPRNRYGWGESIVTPRAVRVGQIAEHPSFPKSLPNQVRCMPGGAVFLEAHVTGDPTPTITWYKDGTYLDTSRYPRFETKISEGTINKIFGIVHKVSIQITDLQLEDEGRYELEAVNPGGRITCGTKLLPTYDCSVLQAQEHINRSLIALSRLDEVSGMTPQFTMRLRDRRVQVGFPVRLTCQVLAVPIPTVNWMRDGVPIVSDEFVTIWQENSHFYTLEVSSACHEDAAVYSVVANNEFGSIRCKSRLVVDSGLKSYISPMYVQELEDICVCEGENIMLHAVIEAYPTIGVVWHRDGHRIRPSRRTNLNLTTDGSSCLIVKDAEYLDGGIYTCTASNEMGRMESFCRVSVESSNHILRHEPQRTIKTPMFLRKPRSVEAEENQVAIVECEIAGDPTPSVNWLKDWFYSDTSIDDARFKAFRSDAFYRLEIQRCRLDDSGAYVVVASNEHGESRAIISLQIHPEGLKPTEAECTRKGVMEHFPRIVKPLQDVKCCDGDSLTLQTLISAPKNSKIRWEKQGKILKLGGDITTDWDGSYARLHIREVYSEDEGEYSCIVYNDRGKAVTSSTIVVEMADDKENDLTVQMDHRPDLSRISTPSRYSRSPSVNFQREGSTHSWAEVGWREPSLAIPHWRPLSRGSSPLLLESRRGPDQYQRSKVRTFQRPKFYYIPHDRIVEEGDSVTFQCAVKGNPVPRTAWDKDSSKIIPGGRMKMEEKNEMRYLEIPKVTQQDAGLYRVTIENDFGREQATARLDVIKASQHKYLGYVRSWNSAPLATPKFMRTLAPTTVRRGARLNLSTNFKGSPKPRAKWYRNGELIPVCREYRQTNTGTTSTLEVIKTSRSDAGTYTCVLVNDSGKAENSCQVIIEDIKNVVSTPPFFVKHLKNISAHDGDQVTIDAEITGSSPLKIVWIKNDLEVNNCKEFRYESTPPNHSLVIADGFPEDSGLYFCEAYNPYGHAVSHAWINISDPFAPNPEPPRILGPLSSITVHEGDAAQFRIKGTGVPCPEITWYLNGKQLKETNRFQIRQEDSENGVGLVYCLRILPALLSDSGTISILMDNSMGTECIHTTFQVNTLPYQRSPPAEKMADASAPKSTSGMSTADKNSSQIKYSPRTSPTQNKLLQKFPKQDSMDSAYASGRNSALSGGDRESSSERASLERSCDMKIIDCNDLESGDESGAVIISGPNDTTTLKAQSATLTATFSGYPNPKITWYKKEKEIQNGGRYTIKIGKIITSLSINDVTFDDCDKYTLKVHNHLSAHSAFASLAVEGVPERPSGKPNLSEVTNTSVTVSWYGPAYDGGRAITGYKVEARRIGTSSWYSLVNSCHSTSFKAEGFDPGTQYEFRVFAINNHGMSESSLHSSPISLHDSCNSSVESLQDYEGHYDEQKWQVVDLQASDLFEQTYDQHEEVGKGRFGIVYKVSEKKSGRKRAAKIIKCLKADDRIKVKEEIAIMNDLKHPKLLQLLAAYERKKDFVMIMEYISGGELFERVVADDFSLTERDCILFIRQISEGVKYMHESSIVHLDLKPENILCVTRTSHKIKLIDFGLARKLDPEKPCRVLFGTPEFVAPEIINYEPISFSSDMWSVGVICYVLLSGLSPFMGENDCETFANITRAEFDFDDDSFDAISEDAKNFINTLLDKRKEKRPSAAECLGAGWLAQKEGTIGHVVLSTDKLKRFIIRRKWQKTGNAIRALGRMANLTNQRNSSPTRLTTLHETKSPIPLSPSSLSTQATQSVLEKNNTENNKTCTSIVNERSDSGISEWSECSTVPEDRSSRLSSTSSLTSLTQNGSGINSHNGVSGTGKRAGLAWQLSIDSAVEEEEEIVSKAAFTPGIKSSNEGLLPVKEISPNTLHKTHSRI